MISQILRREFDSGEAGFYVFVVTPVSLLIAFTLPPSFTPFIMAAAFFPVHFYFTRRENHFRAILYLSVWAMMGFAELSLAVSFNPPAVGAALGLAEPNPLPTAFGWRIADLVYSSALSVVSGGAFFLVKAVMKINDAAYHFGSLLYARNVAGAFFSLAPWKLITGLGHVLAAQGSASVFYARLEGVNVSREKISWLMFAGLALAIAGWLMEVMFQ